ncbi:hypothetical protein [Streptomyces yunnanensis]|nr:hypothetical protein [Streptomyces yunnanensis]
MRTHHQQHKHCVQQHKHCVGPDEPASGYGRGLVVAIGLSQ